MARSRPGAILITGASSGIGRELALAYARRGAHVAICARRAAELEVLAAEIAAAGGRALVLPCDVVDTAAIELAVARAAEVLGSLDMVIANAGIGGALPTHELTVENVARMVDVNTRGAMATLVAGLQVMVRQGRGHLVAVTSLAGRRALPGVSAYNGSKAAVSSFLETLHLDLAPRGIHVSDVQAGFVKTPMVAKARNPRPFEWDAPRAAEYIVQKLEGAPRVVAFQFPLTFLTRLSQYMPYWLYRRLTRNARPT